MILYVVLFGSLALISIIGKEYGWGIAEYATPEQFMGDDFAQDVYRCEPSESFERLTELVGGLFPAVSADEIRRFLG